ncbi:hypothetical protein V491_00283 [Pseudogymnoascus sp. VKM F-3775]|nr:hypothetical protein V491_00283 [Pseudogymnoascus sp. VKM F-3775]
MGRYRPGGYYLVAIGDKLQDLYRVIHKPGHGGYSTTWLARDKRSQKLAAMKVGTAESNPHEANILSALAAPQIPPHVGRMADIAYFLFWTGRATISKALEASNSGMFELNVARALVAQLALVVALMHSEGIVHGAAPEINELSDEQMYDKYGPPAMEPVIQFDGQEIPLGIPTHGIVPRPLFDLLLANSGDLARWQVGAFGILPPNWWILWKTRYKWFDDDGMPLKNREDVYSLEDRFRFGVQEPRQKDGMGSIEQDEQEAFLAMLRSMLKYKPGDRSTAGEILDSEWMRKWAMPEYEKIA